MNIQTLKSDLKMIQTKLSNSNILCVCFQLLSMFCVKESVFAQKQSANYSYENWNESICLIMNDSIITVKLIPGKKYEYNFSVLKPDSFSLKSITSIDSLDYNFVYLIKKGKYILLHESENIDTPFNLLKKKKNHRIKKLIRYYYQPNYNQERMMRTEHKKLIRVGEIIVDLFNVPCNIVLFPYSMSMRFL